MGAITENGAHKFLFSLQQCRLTLPTGRELGVQRNKGELSVWFLLAWVSGPLCGCTGRLLRLKRDLESETLGRWR